MSGTGRSVLKPFSVLLIYPDYITTAYGEEYYYNWVDAETPERAAWLVQDMAAEANPEECEDPEDFAVVGVWPGHIVMDISWCDPPARPRLKEAACPSST